MKIAFLFTLISSITFSLPGQSMIERRLTQDPADDRYASYSPDGQQIIFESNRDENWDIYIMNFDGSHVFRLTTNDSSDRRPSWHPSGNKIVFESNRTGKFELYQLIINDKSIAKINLQNSDTEPIFASFSPDGKMLAFSAKKSDQQSSIVVTDMKGKQLKSLADYGFRSFYPKWSSDGQSLLFFSRHETENKDDEIYSIDLDGSNKKRLTNWPKHNFCPAWSSDGKKIAYVTSMENSRPEIYVMDSNGENQQRITNNEDGDTLPNWSPDGKRLLITGYRNGNYEICELTLNSQE